MFANAGLYLVQFWLANGILTYGPVGPGLWRPACGRSAFALAGSPRVLVGVVPGFAVLLSTVATMLAQGALYRSFSCLAVKVRRKEKSVRPVLTSLRHCANCKSTQYYYRFSVVAELGLIHGAPVITNAGAQ